VHAIILAEAGATAKAVSNASAATNILISILPGLEASDLLAIGIRIPPLQSFREEDNFFAAARQARPRGRVGRPGREVSAISA